MRRSCVDAAPDPNDSMTLQEALELDARGCLPDPPPLTAVEAVKEILAMHDCNLRGWKLRDDAKTQLEKVLAWLIQKEQQGKA
jgi:hypothetical protein